ncbi:MAG: FAD-binding oxidoreductase [Pseudomonadota bacterium]
MSEPFDIAIIGGGIMGCATALRLADGGMAPIVIEQGDIGRGASSANAGTLSLQIKRVKLMPYALRGHALWESFGQAVGFRKTGGYTLAFTAQEAELLLERQRLKADAGAPIRFISPPEVRTAEPGLTERIAAASFCPADGFANSLLTGRFYRTRLGEAGIPYRTGSPVRAISRDKTFAITTPGEIITARRVLLATGGWLQSTARLLGVDVPVRTRINTVSVTERAPPLLSSQVGHATGLLTLKQKDNGTVLIGGGWQGHPNKEPSHTSMGRVNADTLRTNLALARYALPGLDQTRLLRSWTGFEGHTPDFYPLAGALPGVKDGFVLGCVRGGYTIGPYMGQLMGDFILGREPEMPLFDPARTFMQDSSL